MTRTLKQKPILITLVCASIAQLFAIIADQYVLNLDFKIEKLEHSMVINENLQSDLRNTLGVLKFAKRYTYNIQQSAYYDQFREYGTAEQTSNYIINNSLKFMISEIQEIYKIHSVKFDDTLKESKNYQDINTFSEPLFLKMDESSALQKQSNKIRNSLKNQRHLFILLAVVAQILSLLLLLGYFIFELKEYALED